MPDEVFVPKMTDHMEAAQVLQWLVAEGDRVEARQPILEVMTDKVAAEIEAPSAGVLKGIRPGLEPGAVVPVGETIAFVAQPDEDVPSLPPLQPSGVATPPGDKSAPAASVAEPASVEQGKVRATPAARAAARRLGVDISGVKGTGPAGRISEEDVRNFAASSHGAPTEAARVPSPAQVASPGAVPALTPPPTQPGAEFDWVELNPVQRLTGERMAESVRVPQFALEVSVDASSLLAVREASVVAVAARDGEKPSVTAFLAKAVASTLRHHPRLNSSFEGGRLKQYHHVNIAVAVGTEQGLMVPVVKDADRKSIAEVASEIKSLGEKARALRLGTEDVSGGTFTISNLGMYGVDRFTAIINPPEAAILAVGRVMTTMVGLANGGFATRQMMNLTLTVDHRVVDGMQAATFLTDLKKRIEEPY